MDGLMYLLKMAVADTICLFRGHNYIQWRFFNTDFLCTRCEKTASVLDVTEKDHVERCQTLMGNPHQKS
jgi:hypothetical protein